MPGFCHWPAAVFNLRHCRKAEVPDLLGSHVPGSTLLHFYGRCDWRHRDKARDGRDTGSRGSDKRACVYASPLYTFVYVRECTYACAGEHNHVWASEVEMSALVAAAVLPGQDEAARVAAMTAWSDKHKRWARAVRCGAVWCGVVWCGGRLR